MNDASRSVDADRECESTLLDEVLATISEEFVADGRVECSHYCQQYPQFAEQIRAAWPAMKAIANLGTNHDAPRAARPDTPSPIDGVLGDFRIIRELGRGGMGIVYEAHQISLRRRVALKVLPYAAMFDDKQLARFNNEAQAAAMLKHPHIVGVFSVGVDRGVHYYAMELVDGESLSVVISASREIRDKGPSRTSQALTDTLVAAGLSTNDTGLSDPYCRSVVRLTIMACNALQYAHDFGVVHRDVKPSNLLLGKDGQLHLTDFGLAQLQNGQQLTGTGDLLGTLRYMSPEQADGKLVDGRSDIYSLGLVLYELLTLKQAFAENDRQKLLRQISDTNPSSPRSLNASVPRDLETVALKAIDKRPEFRYQTASDLATDLKRFLDHHPVTARRSGYTDLLRRWAQRNPLTASLVMFVILLLLLVGIAGPMVAVRQIAITGEMQRQGYVLALRSAFIAVEEGDFQRANRALAPLVRHRQSSGTETSFELQYAWNRCQRGYGPPALKHSSGIETMTYSPDGEKLAVASGEQLFVWDVTTKRRSQVVKCDRTVSALAFSPDGSILATGDIGGRLVLRRTTDLRVEHTFRQHAKRVRAIAFSPNGELLASTSNDRTVLVRHLRAPGSISRITDNHEFHAAGVAFSPDGTQLASTDGGGNLYLWDTSDFGLVAQTKVSDGWNYYAPVTFSTDGKRLITSTGSISLWNVPDLSLAGRFGVESEYVSLSPDGRLLVAGDRRLIRVIDVDQQTEIAKFPAHEAIITNLSFSPTGLQIASSDRDGAIKFWRTDLWTRSEKRGGWMTSIVSANSQTDSVLVTHGRGPSSDRFGKIRRLFLRSGEWQTILDLAYPFLGAAQSPTEPQLWAVGTTARGDHVVLIVDAQSGTILATLAGHDRAVMGVAFSPDGKTLVSYDAYGDSHQRSTIMFWDVPTWSQRFRIDDCFAERIEFLSNSQLLVAGGPWNVGRICVFDTNPARLAYALPSNRRVLFVNASPDGSLIAAADYDGSFSLWDVRRRKLLRTTQGDGDVTNAIAFTHDGRTIAEGGWDRSVRLWQAASREHVGTLELNSVPISMIFSEDDSALIVGCLDGSVHAWYADGRHRVYVADSL